MKLPRRWLVLTIMCFCCFWRVHAQQLQTPLEKFAIERSEHNLLEQKKIKNYLQIHGSFLGKNLQSSALLLTGISDTGHPIYRSILNAGASITTGAARLQNQLDGLNLEGENIIVGVWDDGLVKDHIELGSRIISKEGTTPQLHSTHVTGTIMATGVNPLAKGMAPKALGTTWDFNNDEAEMAALAKPDQTGLLLSNHSYGAVTGWSKVSGVWKWFGDPAISSSEDYRAGFYGPTAESLDQLAFLAPYYTIVWAAGNDRTEVGDGTHPPDGNGGTGYDCIIPDGVAKNIITVGAVNKVLTYTDPSSVVMSAFSSWGPTDDGRIKPDVVAAGVNLFSLSNLGTNQYATASGTSMATPNTTGSLVLVQELYSKLHGGKFIKAATLKGLAIHTTKEAGSFPGPDYSFGWGLLDVEAAAKVLLQEDNENVFVQELSLNSNQIYALDLHSQANQKITVTICWTDPAGTPVPAALDPTNKMLVNDLDVSIADGSGNLILPWTLDPVNPGNKAVPGNNNRDNVEKIEFNNPLAAKYTITVKHKGQLENGKQDFSLIVSYASSTATGKTYYWIGNTGNWNDGTHWSLTTGGTAANATPGIADNVIFDENSFDGVTTGTISLTADASCKKLTWLTDKLAGLALNAHNLTIAGNFSLAGKNFQTFTAGTLSFNVAGDHAIDLHSGDLSKASLNFIGGTWTISGKLMVDKLTVAQGGVRMMDLSCSLNELNASAATSLDFARSTISGLDQSSFSETAIVQADSASINVTSTAHLNWNNFVFNGKITIESAGVLTLNGSTTIHELDALGGAGLQLTDGSTQNFIKLSLNGAQGNLVSIAATTNAVINVDEHVKLCFDFLNVKNIKITGVAVVNAGLHSTLSNAVNWLQGDCDNVLFADFDMQYLCANSLTVFTDKSLGDMVSWSWDFGDGGSVDNIVTTQKASHSYQAEGKYVVSLKVSDVNTTNSFSKEINITANDLTHNTIIFSGGTLLSFQQATGYQWYRNGEVINAAISRTLNYQGLSGSYTVITQGNACNEISSPFLITGVEAVDKLVQIFPNPAKDFIQISLPETAPTEIIMFDALGGIVVQQKFHSAEITLDVRSLSEGFYHLEIHAASIVKKKIVISR